MLGIDLFLHPKEIIKVFCFFFPSVHFLRIILEIKISVSVSEMFPSKMFLKNDNFGGVTGNIVSGLFWSCLVHFLKEDHFLTSQGGCMAGNKTSFNN